jgi:hypothetical protein
MMDENRAIEPPPLRWIPPLGALGNRDSRARGAATPSTSASTAHVFPAAFCPGPPAPGGPFSVLSAGIQPTTRPWATRSVTSA